MELILKSKVKDKLFCIFLGLSISVVSIFIPLRWMCDLEGLSFSIIRDKDLEKLNIELWDLSSDTDLPMGASTVFLKGKPIDKDPKKIAKILDEKDLWHGILEFDPSWEFSREVAKFRDNLKFFRVHFIKPAEIEKLNLSPKNVYHRFKRAVLERSVEVLWIRSLPNINEENLIKKLENIVPGKLVKFPPSPEKEPPFPKIVPLILLGFLIFIYHPILAILSIIFVFFDKNLVISYLGILGTLAVYDLAKRRTILTILGFFILSLLVNLSLSDFHHLNQILEFRGVKLSLISLPLFIFLKGLYSERKNWKKFLPVFFILIPLGIYYILRSGNFGWISSFERNFRDFLESIFWIRPRFKEILAFPFFLNLKYFKKYRWFFLVEAFGSVALVSMFNTFCHIKAPIFVSLYRTALSLGISIPLSFIIKRILEKL